MKMKIVCLLYAVGDFALMLWRDYHPLLLIVSFWLALIVFYALVSHAQRQRVLARKHRDTLRRVMQEART